MGATSDPLVVDAQATPPETDPSVPVALVAEVTGGESPYDVTWASSSGQFGAGSTWSFGAPLPGNYSVTAYAVDALGNAASYSRIVRVHPDPLVWLGSTAGDADVGLPVSLNFSVVGGVSPFEGTLRVEPAGTDVLVSLPQEGLYRATVAIAAPGSAWAYLSLRDAVGATASGETSLGEAHARPSLALTAASDRAEVGVPIRLLVVVSGGTAPLVWSSYGSQPFSNDSAIGGTVPPSSVLYWSGLPVAPGNLTVFVEVVDADAVSTAANVSLYVAPPLAAVLTAATPAPLAGGGLVLNASVRGGVPPYDYTLALSDGELAVGNLSAAGALNWTAAPRSEGNLTVELRVSDALNRTASIAVMVNVGPPVPSAPGSTSPVTDPSVDAAGWITGILTVVVVVGGGVGLIALRWRRRAASGSSSGDSSRALGEVRGLLGGSDGIERETLDLLAEDAGLSKSETDDAVDRWTRAGRIEVRPGTGGADRLYWRAREDASDVVPGDL